MHLSIATPAPGYPGMAGTLSSCSRGFDHYFCPGGPGIYQGLSGELTLTKKPGFGAGREKHGVVLGLVQGFTQDLCPTCRGLSQAFAGECNILKIHLRYKSRPSPGTQGPGLQLISAL